MDKLGMVCKQTEMETLESGLVWLLLGNKVQTSQRIGKSGHMQWELEQKQLLLFISAFIDFFSVQIVLKSSRLEKVWQKRKFLISFQQIALGYIFGWMLDKGHLPIPPKVLIK
jgi:hypothetical protein